jgi:hypothetical protein
VAKHCVWTHPQWDKVRRSRSNNQNTTGQAPQVCHSGGCPCRRTWRPVRVCVRSRCSHEGPPASARLCAANRRRVWRNGRYSRTHLSLSSLGINVGAPDHVQPTAAAPQRFVSTILNLGIFQTGLKPQGRGVVGGRLRAVHPAQFSLNQRLGEHMCTASSFIVSETAMCMRTALPVRNLVRREVLHGERPPPLEIGDCLIGALVSTSAIQGLSEE